MKKFLIMLAACFLLSGCVEEEIIDDIQLMFAVAYDPGEDGKIKGTVSTPIFTPDQKVKTETYSNSAHTSKGINSKINSESPEPVVSGKVMVVIFNKELAAKGLIHLVDTLQRDPSIGRHVHLAVSEGEAAPLLESEYTTTDSTGMYLSNIIDQNIKYHLLPKTNLHTFLYQYFGKGIDPYLPIIKKHGEHNHALIEGLALFNDEKFVDKLEYKYMFTFQALAGEFKDGYYELVLKNDHAATIFPIDSDINYHINNVNNIPEIVIDIELKGIISEYTEAKITKETLKKIETELEEKLQKQSKLLIDKFQKLNVDPLGLGHIVKSKTRNWKEEDWKNVYPEASIKVKIKTKIIESGVVR
ncbi:Ger(x)C family spore germination protein [Bacillus taeanensis]|uniref:Ger(X)C family spore germination protein n=1 Tax=Bacillus taeanensis TaxID=273032 RepID=A0A366XZH9_9BACI|nr:Ger(x)C family spore germination protein [Bacillus taeanensis]RBW71337.1 hypothetical protein DS031_00880 [Bacillus taeanensis]